MCCSELGWPASADLTSTISVTAAQGDRVSNFHGSSDMSALHWLRKPALSYHIYRRETLWLWTRQCLVETAISAGRDVPTPVVTSGFSDFPDSKVLLVDTGIKKERLAEALLSYEISGIISTDTGFDLFKKALTVIEEGRVWIDKSTIKSFLTESDLVTKKETVRRKKLAG